MKSGIGAVVVLITASVSHGQDADVKRAAGDLALGNPRAVAVLAGMGERAVPELTRLLRDEDGKVRGLAALTLERIGPEARGAAAALAGLLGDEDLSVASQAAQALGRIGPEAAPAIAAALKKDGRPEVAVRAAEALRFLGPAGKESLPALVAVLKKPGRAENLLPIAEALGKMGPAAEAAVEDLARALAPEYVKEGKGAALIREGLHIHVVSALGRIGPGAKKAVPALLALLRETRPTGDPLDLLVLEALASIGAPSEELTTLVVEQIERNQGPRLILYRTLAQTGLPKKEKLRSLAEGMRDRDPWVRLYAAAVVGKLEPDDPAVVSVLIESLMEKEAALRRQAAQYLGDIRPRDESARDALAEAARDPDDGVREAAARALKRYKR